MLRQVKVGGVLGNYVSSQQVLNAALRYLYFSS